MVFVYVLRVYELFVWKQSTNRWIFVGGVSSGATGPMAVDTRRNRLFMPTINFGSGVHAPVTINLGEIPCTVVQHTYSGDTSYYPVNATDNGTPMVFVPHPTDPTQDCFLWRRCHITGGTLGRINASTFFIDTLPTTGGAAIPSERGGGAYTKFLATGLNGIAYAPLASANVWFLRTS